MMLDGSRLSDVESKIACVFPSSLQVLWCLNERPVREHNIVDAKCVPMSQLQLDSKERAIVNRKNRVEGFSSSATSAEKPTQESTKDLV